jgi:Caspase domain/N-acetylmuramoyl-L-alanine amidase
MPAPFKPISIAQFAELIQRFPWTRRINAVHMHHTWKPSHADFKGEETIKSMWRFHTQTNGWSDIAQHVTIDPTGTIWTGRNWNMPPASASGHNGSRSAGPFMFEMIGDFDKGHDPFTGEQKKAAIQVIARIQQKWGLPPESLMFHNMMSTKTCPGNAIDYREVLEEVRQARAALDTAPREADGPFARDTIEADPVVEDALEAMRRTPSNADDPADAEHDDTNFAGAERAASREAMKALSADDLQAMRPYIVNLNMGRFSNDGEWSTSASDVDAIFDEHLEAEMAGHDTSNPLRVVVFAHGGLVNEQSGLQIARKALQWWKDNHVYPLYIVWETGAFESIGDLLRLAQRRPDMPRGLTDFTDGLIEKSVRELGGPKVWGVMKLSAMLASEAASAGDPVGGGGWYLAKRLGAFCAKHAGKLEVHAVGHSAGAIFHSYFIPAALAQKVPQIKTVSFLAPASRIELFKSNLLEHVGKPNGIGNLAIFTMVKDLEKADNCAFLYRKSLLYLIHHALEPEQRAPILGLEESMRSDADIAARLKLPAKPEFNVIWSKTNDDSGRSASRSYTHGGFDDDASTMNSVLRRVLARSDTDAIVPYERIVPASRAADVWGTDIYARYLPPVERNVATEPDFVSNVMPHRIPPHVVPHTGRPVSQRIEASAGGRRRALCVGINRYPSAPLSGCVADARAWQAAFVQLGFETPALLLDEQATRAEIVAALAQLIDESRAGDVIAFQYSGHGTQLPDLDGDESGGTTPDLDEALCPYDFAEGAFLIDDDIGKLCDQLPAGVNLTLFTDCCHSGTISRFAGARLYGAAGSGGGARARFIVPSEMDIEAHKRFRERSAASRSRGARTRSSGPTRELLFAACLDKEVAWESNGHGAFTDHALRVLLGSGAARLTNAGFAQQVIDAFGPQANQHPQLYGLAEANSGLLLEPVVAVQIEPDRASVPAQESGHANGEWPGSVRVNGNDAGNGHLNGNGHISAHSLTHADDEAAISRIGNAIDALHAALADWRMHR